MKNISIYPHYGFINTDFIISSKNLHIESYLKVLPEERILNLPPSGGYIGVKFQPGKHQLLLLDSNDNIVESEDIFVEDAIKIGGSIFSGKFVLSDWVILVMKDRSYFYNRISKSERMEFKIHPDNIIQITSDILLFEEKNYFNFFSMDTMKSIVRFRSSQAIFYDKEIIVYKSENNEISILKNFTHKHIITYDEYIFHEESRNIYTHNSVKDQIKVIDFQNEIIINYISIAAGLSFIGFTNRHYAILKDEKNNYFIKDLKNNSELINLPVNIIRNCFSKTDCIDLKVYNNYIKINNKLTLTIVEGDLYIIEVPEKRVEHVTSKIIYEYTDIKKYIVNDLNDFNPILLNNSKIYFQNKRYIVFSDHPSEYSTIEIYDKKCKELKSFNNVKGFKFENECIYTKNENSKNEIYNLNGNLLIEGKKIDIDYRFKNSGIIKVDNSFYHFIDGQFNEIVIDSYISRNIVFKDSGFYYFIKGELRALPYKLDNFIGNEDCILYEENNNWNLLNWDKKTDRYVHTIIFSSIDRNYYKCAMFCEDGSQLLCQQKNKTYCFYNILSGEITPYHLDTSVQRNFNANQLLVSNNKNKRIVFKDPISLKPITTEYYSLYRFFSLDGQYHISFDKANMIKEEISITEKGKKERKYYLEITEKEGNKTIKIYTSGYVKHINYVSFSYDSKFVSFVGATPSCGYLLIYDLVSKQILFEYPSKEKSSFCSGAIWIASFNKDGKLSIYNSNPTTYIFSFEEGCNSYISIPSRNFLCYSPTGNYMALSTQGYNAWAYGTNNKWGHQKSTKVFIRKTNSANMELGPLEIFGNVEIPRATQDNVGSVAFSLDESKILVVLNDGTLIIKNIQLNDESLWEDKQDNKINKINTLII